MNSESLAYAETVLDLINHPLAWVGRTRGQVVGKWNIMLESPFHPDFVCLDRVLRRCSFGCVANPIVRLIAHIKPIMDLTVIFGCRCGCT